MSTQGGKYKVSNGVRGTVTITTLSGFTLTLKDALYCDSPSSHNLISVFLLCENGFEHRFRPSPSGPVFSLLNHETGEELLTSHGDRHGRLFPLPLARHRHDTVLLADPGQGDSSVILWHRRLAHLNLESLRKLTKLSVNMAFTDVKERHTFANCHSCLLSKSKRISHPPQPVLDATVKTPLRRLHSDVFGPLPQGTGGVRYFIVFVDEVSRFSFVFLMKRKNEIVEKLSELLALIRSFPSRASKFVVKMLHSDNAYIARELKEFCLTQGITQTFSPPYTPNQNGLSERTGGVLIQKARTLMLDSSFLRFYPYLWPDAVKTACLLRNVSPQKHLSVTPFEALHGLPPNLSSIRVFGCQAFAHIPAQVRVQSQKFEARALSGYNLGFDSENQSYRIWIPSSQTIRVTRDVTFDESKTLVAPLLSPETDEESHELDSFLLLNRYHSLSSSEPEESMRIGRFRTC